MTEPARARGEPTRLPYDRIATTCLAVVAAFCALDVTLWLAGSPPRFGLGDELPMMKANTALSLVACSAAGWLGLRRRATASRALLALVALFHTLTLVEYLTGRDLGIDQLLVRAAVVDSAPPGRTALATCLGMLALTGSLACLGRLRRLGDALALAVTAIGLLVVILFAYGAHPLLAVPALRVSLFTALALLLLAVAAFSANEDGPVARTLSSRTAGGLLARRLVPASVLVPIALGWVRLLSIQYDVIDPATGLAILELATIASLLVVVAWSASSLTTADAERRRAELAATDAREVAEAATRAKDEFMAMLGHELRNPLAPIFSALELIALRAAPGAPADPEIAAITRASRRLQRLVDDLLDISRITRGELRIVRAPVDTRAIITEAVETVSSLFRDNGNPAVIDVPDEELWVDGDEARLVQVLVNLLANASKHGPPGTPIAITARRAGDAVELVVRDEGAGIPPELLPHVFEPFVQASQATDRRRGGLGLGLSIVRSIVEAHGGAVSLAPGPHGLGTAVTLRLRALAPPPRSVAAPPPPARAATQPPRSRADQRILVVDDNVDAAELLAAYLEAHQFRVDVAHSGAEALAHLAERRPALAVLDIGLPEMDGHEVARAIRADPRCGGIGLFALTGYGGDDDRARARESGFDAHFTKPVEPRKLLRAIRDHLDAASAKPRAME